MKAWTSPKQDCWRCCVATLAGVHPTEVPTADYGLDIEEQNRFLASRGYRLEPVPMRASFGESYPKGRWIALLRRGPRSAHSVIAEGNVIVHDPAYLDGWSGTLWPNDLVYARDRDMPLGFELVEV